MSTTATGPRCKRYQGLVAPVVSAGMENRWLNGTPHSPPESEPFSQVIPALSSAAVGTMQGQLRSWFPSCTIQGTRAATGSI